MFPRLFVRAAHPPRPAHNKTRLKPGVCAGVTTGHVDPKFVQISERRERRDVCVRTCPPVLRKITPVVVGNCGAPRRPRIHSCVLGKEPNGGVERGGREGFGGTIEL
ncbi:hypothetical protein NL108_013052 [Boleophthalmus pectinirostris]|nr:hypothetical protein NL108_013052 [Boleophthalmus pectinirostris]